MCGHGIMTQAGQPMVQLGPLTPEGAKARSPLDDQVEEGSILAQARADPARFAALYERYFTRDARADRHPRAALPRVLWKSVCRWRTRHARQRSGDDGVDETEDATQGFFNTDRLTH
jgi:hypothetical protein